jgi:acyl carrier protein
MPSDITISHQSAKSSREEIQVWLVKQIAGLMYVDPKTIDITAPFNSFGLSSRDAVMLSGDLEEWLDRRLSPTLLYEYPTIAALAAYLSGEQDLDPEEKFSGSTIQQSEVPPAVQAVRLDGAAGGDQAFDQRLTDLEQLSDDEAEALLLDRLNKLKQ